MTETSKGTHAARFTYIDGLRGVAALYVLVYHFYNQVSDDGRRQLLIEPFHTVVKHGWLGVEIFFVLSGFVIAYSIRGAHVTGRYIGNFAFRRSLRLDPPYWVVILITFVLLRVSLSYGGESTIRPEPQHLLSSMLYLDRILRTPGIVTVGWTLCLEVQLYLVFITLVMLSQRLAPKIGRQTALAVVFAPLALLSLTMQHGLLPAGIIGLFLPWFAMFFAGALAWWSLAGVLPHRWLLGYLAFSLAFLVFTWDIRTVAVATTAISIWYLGRRQALTTALDYPIVQYFGRISYSLYLVHPLLGHRAIRVARRFLPTETMAARVALFFGAALVSIAVAHLLYVCVERPGIRFAARFRRPRATTSSQA